MYVKTWHIIARAHPRRVRMRSLVLAAAIPALQGAEPIHSHTTMTSSSLVIPIVPSLQPTPSAEWRERLRAFADTHLHHSAWGVAHAQRDYALTLRLAGAEHVVVDTDAVYAAAYLHDMGAFPEFAQDGVDHGVRSAQLVGDQLSAVGFPSDKIPLVQDIVEHHMYDHTVGASPEAILFRDADTLDFLGAIGMARICSITTRHRCATDLPAAIATIRRNANVLPASLRSVAAKREGIRRVADLHRFLDALDADVGPSRAY